VVSRRYVLALRLVLGSCGATAADTVHYASSWLALDGVEKRG
jgi:hypothetical protein